jgi:hypothetical protein
MVYAIQVRRQISIIVLPEVLKVLEEYLVFEFTNFASSEFYGFRGVL